MIVPLNRSFFTHCWLEEERLVIESGMNWWSIKRRPKLLKIPSLMIKVDRSWLARLPMTLTMQLKTFSIKAVPTCPWRWTSRSVKFCLIIVWICSGSTPLWSKGPISTVKKVGFSKFSVQKHNGPENLKMSRPKKLVKSNKIISRNFFLTKIHFLQFQK